MELDVAEVVLHRALRHVLETTGEPVEAYRVSDRPDRPCDVLVTHLTPMSCREAVRAVRDGTARVVLCADRPDDLPAVLGRLATSWCAIPARVLVAADLVAGLSSREQALARALGLGQPLAESARALGVSETTLKRDLRRVGVALGAQGRATIAARARELDL